MRHDLIKYERGQIWRIRNKNPNLLSYDPERVKDRSWLILSIGEFNQSTKRITAVPIVRRKHTYAPSQVLFEDGMGRKNVIPCEEVMSFDYSSGAYIFDYIGELPKEVLEKVDEAISIHLGVHYFPINLRNLYDSMEEVIKSIESMQQIVDASNSLDEVAASTDTYTEDFDSTPGVEMHITEYQREDTLPSQDISVSTPIPTMESYSTTEDKTANIRWTKEVCEEFLHDAETMPMDKVMDKWNIFKKARFYSTKTYVKTLMIEKYS